MNFIQEWSIDSYLQNNDSFIFMVSDVVNYLVHFNLNYIQCVCKCCVCIQIAHACQDICSMN